MSANLFYAIEVTISTRRKYNISPRATGPCGSITTQNRRNCGNGELNLASCSVPPTPAPCTKVLLPLALLSRYSIGQHGVRWLCSLDARLHAYMRHCMSLVHVACAYVCILTQKHPNHRYGSLQPSQLGQFASVCIHVLTIVCALSSRTDIISHILHCMPSRIVTYVLYVPPTPAPCTK